MERYIRVDWPESQEWMWGEHRDEVYCNDDASVFVPEELYNEVNGREEPTFPDASDPIWDEYEGMPEESKPWFMKNE